MDAGNYTFSIPLTSESLIVKGKSQNISTKTFACKVMAPGGKLFDAQVSAVFASGMDGSFSVWPDHAPMVSLLTKGILRLSNGQTDDFFAIDSGILEVNADEKSVLVLVDNAVKVQNADEMNQELSKFSKKSTPKK